MTDFVEPTLSTAPARRIERPRIARWVAGASVALIVPAAIVAVWQAVAIAGLAPPYLLPRPIEVIEWLARLALSGELFLHLRVSMFRALSGFVIGAAVATALGVLTGYAMVARNLLDPTIHALRTIPGLAWTPMFILWFGIGEASKVALIALVTFFPVYLNTMAGVAGVDRKLIEVGRVNRLGGARLMWTILLPAATPSYFVGLRQSMGVAWIVVVAAELMGASRGIGFLLLDGQMTGRPALVMACMIVFAISGKTTDWVISAIARRALRWQDTLERAN